MFNDLKAAARKGGFQLYGNGAVAQKTVKTAMYVLKCCHGRQVRTDVVGKMYRGQHAVNSRKAGRRIDGKSLPQ